MLKKWLGLCYLIALLGLSACGELIPTPPTVAGTPTPGQTSLTTASATVTLTNGQTVLMRVELARTSQEQETGLMGRTSIPENTGMLFIFPEPVQIGFWMKDTPMPLSIAFISSSGQILDIQDMAAYSEEVHSPGKDYLYGLEVPQGYFSRKGIKAGDKFTLIN